MKEKIDAIVAECRAEYGYDFYSYFDNCPEENRKLLDEYVLTCDPTVFKNAGDIYHEYYGMIVPDDIIRQLFLKNHDLTFENHIGSMYDTCVREQLGDALCRYLGLPHWPMNGSSNVYKQKFYEAMKSACVEHGIECLWGTKDG